MVLDAFYLIRVMAMTSGLPALSIHTWHRLRCRRLETDQHLSAARVPQQTEQFGIVRNADPFADGWIAQSFADDARLTTDAYSNTGGGKHDPYPVAGTGTGVYELAGGHPYIGVTDFTMRRDNPDGPPTGGNNGVPCIGPATADTAKTHRRPGATAPVRGREATGARTPRWHSLLPGMLR